MNTALVVIAVLLVLGGIAGTILPALPGPPLVFAGLLLAAYADKFQHVSAATLWVLAVLTVVSIGIDILATMWGAKRVGASGPALWGAAIGTIVGLFLGIPGLIIGPFLGAAAGELYTQADFLRAGRVGFGTMVGLVMGMVLRLGLVFGMIAIFVTAYFF